MVKRLLIVLVVLVMGLSLGFPIVTFFNSINLPVPSSPPGNEQPNTPQPLAVTPQIKFWQPIEDFDRNLAVFETVFWEPRDTESLRKLIRAGGLTEGKEVLEIGTGSGLLALCCLRAGAKKVVATDVNHAAVANLIYNAENLKLAGPLSARQVPLDDSSAFSVIAREEKFDLIISNPPWVNRQPLTIEEYALYDANFSLMKSLFEGLRDHLKPGGRVLLAYGCVDAINTLQKLATKHQLEFIIRDERRLDELPEEFLPGMLVEIRRQQE